jgi:hypothetical protein
MTHYEPRSTRHDRRLGIVKFVLGIVGGIAVAGGAAWWWMNEEVRRANRRYLERRKRD